MTAPSALLLVGPTGSGKSPLGDLLAARGLKGRTCLHFDFGAELRRAEESDGSDTSDLSDADRTLIRRILKEGALLEPEDFPVAERLLGACLARHRARPEDLLILNGLPRHVQQAEALRGMVDIKALVELQSAPHVVLDRIRTNSGGDRTGRVDDGWDSVAARIALYEQRTRPLIRWYTERGVLAVVLHVDDQAGPEDLLVMLDDAVPHPEKL